jgi:hypothetical protein
MSKQDGGRIARTAGLVVTTSISAAAIQCTTWDAAARISVTVLVIVVGAFTAAVAADFGGTET